MQLFRVKRTRSAGANLWLIQRLSRAGNHPELFISLFKLAKKMDFFFSDDSEPPKLSSL